MDTHTIYRVQALLQEAYELLDILYAQHPANLTPSTVVNPPAFNLDAMVETATAKVQDFINGQAYLAQRDIINACQEAMLKSNQRHDAYLVENFPLGGVLSADSKAKDIPSGAVSQVKARHLAALRDAIRNRGTT